MKVLLCLVASIFYFTFLPPSFCIDEPGRLTSSEDEIVICIDPGHGGRDTGVVGGTGSWEKDICLKIAKEMKDILKEQSPDVICVLTRDEDYDTSLRNRWNRANSSEADLFISLHLNSSPVQSMDGMEIFYSREEDLAKISPQRPYIKQSLKLAQTLAHFCRDRLEIPEPDIYAANLVVLKNLSIPAVLVEIDFFSNPAREFKLIKRKWQREIASVLAQGAWEFLHYCDSQ